MKETLLEKAHKIQSYEKSFTDEQIQLAIAYIKDEVTITQAQKATNIKHYRWKVTQILQYANRKGRLKISIIRASKTK